MFSTVIPLIVSHILLFVLGMMLGHQVADNQDKQKWIDYYSAQLEKKRAQEDV